MGWCRWSFGALQRCSQDIIQRKLGRTDKYYHRFGTRHAVGRWCFAGCACAAAEVVAVVAPLIADDAEEMVGPAACSSYPCFGYPGSYSCSATVQYCAVIFETLRLRMLPLRQRIRFLELTTPLAPRINLGALFLSHHTLSPPIAFAHTLNDCCQLPGHTHTYTLQ